jgi:4-amino-4-deoxy-L-arabinose transferase-like glycosyltransferase
MRKVSSSKKPMPKPAEEKPWWAKDGSLLGLMLLASLLLRLPNLTESLWYDEVCYTSVFFKSNLLQNILFRDVHPLLYPLLMLLWEKAFGDAELIVRLPSLLFGLASIAMLFIVVKRWFDRKTAWLATGLLALSPVHIWYSHEAKNNMLLLLMTLVTVYRLQIAWTENRPRNWLLFVVSALTALWTNVFALWIVCALFMWLGIQVLREGGRSRMCSIGISGAAVFLGWLPFVWMSLSHADLLARSYLRPFTLVDAYYLFLIYLSHGNTLRTISPYKAINEMLAQPWWFFLFDAFFLALLVAGLRAWRRQWLAGSTRAALGEVPGRAKIELLSLYLLIPPLALMAASRVYAQLYIERSMIILLPPVVVLMACGVAAWRSPLLRRITLALLLLLNSWALLNLYVTKSDTWTVYKQNPDWRSAARYFGNEILNSNGNMFILTTTPGEALDYSYSRFLKSEMKQMAGNLPATLPHGRMDIYDEKKFIAFLARFGFTRFYLIHELTWSQNFESLLRSLQGSPAFEASGKAGFKDLDIYQFRVNLAAAR